MRALLLMAIDPQGQRTAWICQTRLGKRVARWRRRYERFHDRHADAIQAVMAVAVLLIAIAVLHVALDVKSTADRQAALAQQTQMIAAETRVLVQDQAAAVAQNSRLSKLACQRTRQFSPDIGRFLRRFDVLSPQLYAEYLGTIPKHC